jgi:hypothetical protein
MTSADIQPRALADLLRGMGDAALEADQEIGAILRDAQHRLEALAWNRYAAHVNRQSARQTFTRRHKGLREACAMREHPARLQQVHRAITTTAVPVEQELAHALDTLRFLGWTVGVDLPAAQAIKRCSDELEARVQAIQEEAHARQARRAATRLIFAGRHKPHTDRRAGAGHRRGKGHTHA